jgi:predicted RNA binding protein YcfA (HicA-like mRNA interferase family)
LGKLRILSGQQVCQILESQGFIKVRQRGSHIIMQKVFEDDTITILVPNHKTLAIVTLQSIIKQSGLSRKLFEA